MRAVQKIYWGGLTKISLNSKYLLHNLPNTYNNITYYVIFNQKQ